MKIRRIQDTLIRAFAALIVVALLLLGTLSYYYLHKILIQNAEETTMQLVSQLNRIIENYIRYMDDIALMAVNNEDVREFISSPRADRPGCGPRSQPRSSPSARCGATSTPCSSSRGTAGPSRRPPAAR